MVHGILSYAWERCIQEKTDYTEEPLHVDEDDADLAPAVRQKLRLTKVQAMLSQSGAVARFARLLIITKPLSDYMDQASLLETIRIRLRMRRHGLRLEASKCQHSALEFAKMNVKMLMGGDAWDVISKALNLLTTRQSEELHSAFGINVQDSMTPLIVSICDCWRRLVLPFQRMPWQLLRIVDMEPDVGVPFMQGLKNGR